MITWTCHSCGDTRPDNKISVFSYPIPGFFGAKRNWRYCNDRPTCYAKASEASQIGRLSAMPSAPQQSVQIIQHQILDNLILQSKMPLYLSRAAGKEKYMVDQFIFKQLKEHAPLAYWFLSKKIFQKRFVARLFDLAIEERRREDIFGREVRVLVRGRVIGTMLITVNNK